MPSFSQKNNIWKNIYVIILNKMLKIFYYMERMLKSIKIRPDIDLKIIILDYQNYVECLIVIILQKVFTFKQLA